MLAESQKVLEVLQAARKLIERREHWSRAGWGGSQRRCMAHALRSALEARGLEYVSGLEVSQHPAYQAISRATGANMGGFNDTHTHEEVLAVFDRAIETTEAEIRILSNLIVYEDEPTEPTPNADAALAVMEACESAGEVVARQIVSMNPELDFDALAEVAASELFYAAQDTAWAFEMGVKVER